MSNVAEKLVEELDNLPASEVPEVIEAEPISAGPMQYLMWISFAIYICYKIWKMTRPKKPVKRAVYVGKRDKEQKKHGQGKLTDVAGNVYEGEFVHGVKQGLGKYTFKNGGTYTGEFSNDAPNGTGRETYGEGRDMTYQGEFKDGNRHGWGQMNYSNGSFFRGTFNESFREGMGAELDASKENIFVGEYKNGRKEGLGVHVTSGPPACQETLERACGQSPPPHAQYACQATWFTWVRYENGWITQVLTEEEISALQGDERITKVLVSSSKTRRHIRTGRV